MNMASHHVKTYEQVGLSPHFQEKKLMSNMAMSGHFNDMAHSYNMLQKYRQGRLTDQQTITGVLKGNAAMLTSIKCKCKLQLML